MKNRGGAPAAIIAAPAVALIITITGCANLQAASGTPARPVPTPAARLVPAPASSSANTQAQANAHARAVMARCVREHPLVSLLSLEAQVTCAVPPGYRKAARRCITLGLRGARRAFTRRKRITQVFAEECMASNR
jgi:hypothetical protein